MTNIKRFEKHIYKNKDGHYIYFPDQCFAYNGETLKLLGEYLDKLNKPWHGEILHDQLRGGK